MFQPLRYLPFYVNHIDKRKVSDFSAAGYLIVKWS